MMDNFFERIGRINLFPNDREVELTIPARSDAEAFQEDLQQVGRDMYSAMQAIDSHKYSK